MYRKVTKGRLLVLMVLLATSVLMRVSAPLRAQEANYIMDIGFRPSENGFGFPNYGGQGETNLTPFEMLRLFGEEVCASQPDENGNCDLTAPAAAWMEEVSMAMEGGHCEGMAVLSLLFYGGALNPADYGADYTVDLPFEDEWVQREIALWFATQATAPTYERAVIGTPTQVLEELVNNMENEYYTIGILTANGDGGHAITPYAVEDMGNGYYNIMVYDNNYPFEERFIEVDTNADTWIYTGSTNPDEATQEYYGDAQTQSLSLTPMRPRLEQQVCSFCGAAQDYGAGEENIFNASLNGRGNLLITDSEGRVSGFKDGKQFAEIPGTVIIPARNLGGAYRGPKIQIPNGVVFTIEITAAEGDHPATRITIERRGNLFAAKNIAIGETPINLAVDGNTVKIDGDSASGGSDPLAVQQAITSQNGYNNVYGMSGVGGAAGFEIDGATGNAKASGTGAGKLFVSRTDPSGETKLYYSDEFSFMDGASALLEVDGWGDTLSVSFVDDAGNVLDTIELESEPLDDEFMSAFDFDEGAFYFDFGEGDNTGDTGDADHDGIIDSDDADDDNDGVDDAQDTDDDGDSTDDSDDAGDTADDSDDSGDDGSTDDTGTDDSGDDGGSDDTGDTGGGDDGSTDNSGDDGGEG